MTNKTPIPQSLIIDILSDPDFESLLKGWATEKIFNRGLNYFQQKRVKNLVHTLDEKILATVKGTRNYICSIYLDEENNLAGDCTCPYDDICKHIVALGLEAKATLSSGMALPLSDDLDFREEKLNTFASEGSLPINLLKLKEAFSKLPREKLQELLIKACELDKNIAIFCALSAEPDKIGIELLINDVKNTIANAVVSPDFEDDSEALDYKDLAQKLEMIIEAAKPEAALELIKKIFEISDDIINNFDYNGEIIEGVGEVAMTGVRALKALDWLPSKKIIWIIKSILGDNFGYCEVLEEYLWEITDDKAIWAEVSSFLSKFKAQNVNSLEYSSLGRLQKLVLKKAGKEEELLQLYISEAEENHDYLKLVEYLLKQQKYAEAEKWIRKGIKLSKFPYQQRNLRERLIEIREKEGHHHAVIILQTEIFVENPGVESYIACAKAAEKAGNWKELQELLKKYLRTGAIPWLQDTWPYEQKGSVEALKRTFPLYYELIELALYEKRPLDALNFFDQQRASEDRPKYSEIKIAEAIKDVAPERSLVIWKRESERLIAQTDSKSYLEAGNFIRKMLSLPKKICAENYMIPWLLSLKEQHKRKKNFIKILEEIEQFYNIKY